METSYFRTAAKSFMIISDAQYPYETHELQMVLHNEISILLSLQVLMKEGANSYWYEVTGMQSLAKQQEFQKIDFDGLQLLLHGICDLKGKLEGYFLDDTYISFQAEHIYYDRLEKRFRFCYIPGLPSAALYSIEGLMEYLLQHVDHGDEQAVRAVYDLYEQTMESGFSLESCRAILQRAQKTERQWISDKKMHAELEANSPFMNADPDLPKVDWQEEYQQKKENRPKRIRQKKQHRSWKERVRRRKDREQEPLRDVPPSFQAMLDEAREGTLGVPGERWGQTVCFSDFYKNQKWEFHYVGDGTEEDFSPEQYPYLIGKDPDAADGVLHAETISRVHACLQERDGDLYLEDYNSTNGTYVNGKIIPLNTEIKLEKGDHIVFATEEYLLRQTLHINRGLS